MASRDSVMVMGDWSADSRELAANYAVTARDAFGVSASRWDEPGLHAGVHATDAVRRAAALTYTRLVQRWNLPHAQANLWFVGMLGEVRSDDLRGARTMWSPAVQADYETTRVYLGGGVEPMRGRGIRHDTGWLRAGFSFYAAEYEDPQPWLIVEAKRARYRDAAKNEITPMLRVIHRRYFVEFGASRSDGETSAMFNFMYTH
jgi:hypothetical protein